MIAQVENLRSLRSEHRGCLLFSKLIQQRLEVRIFHCPPSHRLATNLEGSFSFQRCKSIHDLWLRIAGPPSFEKPKTPGDGGQRGQRRAMDKFVAQVPNLLYRSAAS